MPADATATRGVRGVVLAYFTRTIPGFTRKGRDLLFLLTEIWLITFQRYLYSDNSTFGISIYFAFDPGITNHYGDYPWDTILHY